MKRKILLCVCLILAITIVTVGVIFLVKTYGGNPSMPGPRVEVNEQVVIFNV